MKKKIITTIALLTVLFAVLLTGCKKITECDFCGEKGLCETRDLLGEEIHICTDCLEELENLGK